jgi:hypothetical protein
VNILVGPEYTKDIAELFHEHTLQFVENLKEEFESIDKSKYDRVLSFDGLTAFNFYMEDTNFQEFDRALYDECLKMLISSDKNSAKLALSILFVMTIDDEFSAPLTHLWLNSRSTILELVDKVDRIKFYYIHERLSKSVQVTNY